MVAGAASCTCAACGTECHGKFAACKDVWLAGPVTRAPLEARYQASTPVPTNGASSPPSEQMLGGSRLAFLEDRLRDLDGKVAELAWELRALRKQVREPKVAKPANEDRLSHLDARIDRITIDLAEALQHVLRPRTPEPVPAGDTPAGEDARALGQRITDMGRELRRVQNLALQQQAFLDRLVEPRGPQAPQHSDEGMRREPAVAPSAPAPSVIRGPAGPAEPAPLRRP